VANTKYIIARPEKLHTHNGNFPVKPGLAI